VSRRWLIAGLIVAIPIVAWGVLTAASFAFRTTVEDTASIAQPVDEIVVDGSGDVKVVADETAEHVTVDWRSRYFVDRPEVTWRTDGDTLILDSDCGTFGVITNCTTHFTLRVPTGIALDVDTSSGDVEVEGETGVLTLATSSGDVVARAAAPAIALDTSSGDVVVDGSATDVTASTSSGDVEITIAGEPPDAVRAETSSGDVLVEVPYAAYAVETDTDSGDDDVEGIRQDGAASRTIVARTSSGDVKVRAS
jgi:hypothetical protein